MLHSTTEIATAKPNAASVVVMPVVTPEEMTAIDEAAIAELSHEHSKPLEILISRAGEAVAKKARQMLTELCGQCYGCRVLVLAGKGNNGKDGKEAARRLRSWGVQVLVVDIADQLTDSSALPKSFQPINLIIDAAYGTGLSRPCTLPEFIKSLIADIPVLAVDIASGVCGLTGQVLGEALPATATVTFGAYKPGLLFGEGKTLSGEVEVASIGLDASSAKAHMLTADSLAALLPKRDANAHKWNAACWVIGGSPGMTGAPSLAASAAYRAGAGYVRVSTPNSSAAPSVPEAVGFALPETCWGEAVMQASDRFHSLVVGPGLSTSEETRNSVQKLLKSDAVISGKLAMVIDGGALEALGKSLLEAFPESSQSKQKPQIVLTPHDREYAYLCGSAPGADRIQASRELAKATGAVVLLKGPTTVVSHPDGPVLLSAAGDQRLATAGTGDVLAGIIGALLAQGLGAFQAAALGAELHGRAARLGSANGLLASDICDLLPQALRHRSKTQMT